MDVLAIRANRLISCLVRVGFWCRCVAVADTDAVGGEYTRFSRRPKHAFSIAWTGSGSIFYLRLITSHASGWVLPPPPSPLTPNRLLSKTIARDKRGQMSRLPDTRGTVVNTSLSLWNTGLSLWNTSLSLWNTGLSVLITMTLVS